MFFSLLIVMTAALMAALFESSRLAAAHCMLRFAANGAAESVLAEYSLELWEQYDLLFLDAGYGGLGICSGELENRAKEWLESRLTGRHSVLAMKAGAVKLTGCRTALEDGEFLRAVKNWHGYGAGSGFDRVPERMEERMSQAAFCGHILEEMADAADAALELEHIIRRMGRLQEEDASQPDGAWENEEEKEAWEEELSSLTDEFEVQMQAWREAVKRMGDVWPRSFDMEPTVSRRLETLYNGFLRYETALGRRWRQALEGEASDTLREDWSDRARVFYDSRCRQRMSPSSWLPGVAAALKAGSYGIEPVKGAFSVPAGRADREKDGRILASYITTHFTSLASRGSGQIRCEQEYLLTGADNDRDGYEQTLRMAVQRLTGLVCLSVLEQDSRWNELLSFSQELALGSGSESSRSLVICAYLLNAQGFAAAVDQAEALYTGGTAVLKWGDLEVELNRGGLMGLMLSETWDEDQINRCLGLIQHSMRRMNPCFALEQCLGGVELQMESGGRYPGRISVSMEY